MASQRIKTNKATTLNVVPHTLLGIFLIIWGLIGRYYNISTLQNALIVTLGVLAISLYQRRLSNLHVVDFWMAGFLYLFLGEYLNGQKIVLATFDFHTLAITEAFIVSAYGATLLGYSFFLVPALRRLAENNRQDNTASRMNTSDYLENTKIPVEIVFVLFLFIILLLYYTFFILTPQEIFFTARSQRVQADTIFNAAIVILPVFSIYIINRFESAIPIKIVASIAGLWAISIVFSSGTRFWLGFSAFGVLFYLLNGFVKINFTQKIIFAAFLIMIFFGQNIMLSFRSTGNISTIDFTSFFQMDNSFDIKSEGILHINAWIHQAEKSLKLDNRLPENLFLFYWWVPRSIWNSKPTMAGYWFIREETRLSGFSEGHSVSGGFAMPALLDFGPLIGIVFSTAYGILLAVIEALVYRYRYSTAPTSMMVGLFYFGVFFMVRSLQTSLIYLMLLGIGIVLPINIVYHAIIQYRRRHNRPFHSHKVSFPVE